jgi:glutamate-ammonia-ligase adenylyltransferase
MPEFLPENAAQAVAALPESLREQAETRLRECLQGCSAHARPAAEAVAGSLARVLALSDFFARSLAADATLLPSLVESGDLLHGDRSAALRLRLDAAMRDAHDDAALKRGLRRFRRREMARIVWRDLGGLADLDETLAMLSALADACVAVAVERVSAALRAEYGIPRAPGGEEAGFVVLALGKLGGGELNFSSDIDLIFAYTADGEIAGRRALSNHEFFLRLGQRLIAVLNDATEDGFVFRVDMRLRPDGASGPLALSADAMESYYQTHGREWERYAFVKARAIGGDLAAGERLLARLMPFVYRRYLDYSAIEAIHDLKQKIEQELRRKGIEANIKLGPGGIREIEFIGQAFQLVRGGREPELRVRAIREVLARLAERGVLSRAEATELDAAYVFLRNAENRLQMQDDRQTHELPDSPDARVRLATAMGFADWPAFVAQLGRHMRAVHARFEGVFSGPQHAALADDPLARVWGGSMDTASALSALAAAGYRDANAALTLLQALRDGASLRGLSPDGRTRLDRLMPHLIAAAGETDAPDAALARLIRLIEAIGRRPAYFSLLAGNPLALSQLARLASASASIAAWLTSHPILLDELVDPAALYAPWDRARVAGELARILASIPAEDLSTRMDRMREFRQAQTLRCAAADIAGRIGADEVSARLTDLAEIVVAAALEVARAEQVRAHGRPMCVNGERSEAGFADGTEARAARQGWRGCGFAIIGYGKLGSRELGYGADLDMIFLYEDCEGGQSDGTRSLPNEMYFARLAQRVIHILTTRTAAGELYPVDTRLRPNGASGLLVTGLSAFARYQRENAWTWEQQALIRARPIAGDAAIREGFERIRVEMLCRERDPAQLQRDVREMRARMRASRQPSPAGFFHVKHDPGGLIDIEFMVQYLALRAARRHPEILGQHGNIGLLHALSAAGELDGASAQALASAYRHYLSLDQRVKLGEANPVVPMDAAGEHPAGVCAQWQALIGNTNEHGE